MPRGVQSKTKTKSILFKLFNHFENVANGVDTFNNIVNDDGDNDADADLGYPSIHVDTNTT